MYCTECGYEIDKDDSFCSHCGAKVKIPITDEAQKEKRKKNSRKRRGKKKWIVVILTVFLVIFSGIYLGRYLERRLLNEIEKEFFTEEQDNNEVILETLPVYPEIQEIK